MRGIPGRLTVGMSQFAGSHDAGSKSAMASRAVWRESVRASLAVVMVSWTLSWMLAIDELMSLLGAQLRKLSGQLVRWRGESNGPLQMSLCFVVA